MSSFFMLLACIPFALYEGYKKFVYNIYEAELQKVHNEKMHYWYQMSNPNNNHKERRKYKALQWEKQQEYVKLIIARNEAMEKFWF